MSNDTDMGFDFDGAPPAGSTLTDQQSDRASFGGDYDDFDSDVKDDSPKKPTPCNATFAKPRKFDKDGDSGVVIDFTASDGDHIGFEAALFLTLKGNSTKTRRGLQDLAKLCKKLGIPSEGKTSDILQQVAEKANDAEIAIKLNPGKSGGVFVNL